jgi:large subunit GTPase 1
LEKYITDVGEGKKEFMLLINKSDFLSEELIKHWNDYFNERGVKHLFFSALKEQNKLDNVDSDAGSDKAESD